MIRRDWKEVGINEGTRHEEAVKLEGDVQITKDAGEFHLG